MIKNKFTDKEKNALTAIFLCLLLFIILPFLLVRFTPSAADWLREQNILMMAPVFIIGLIMNFIVREPLLQKDDFKNIPYAKISALSFAMIFVCGILSLSWIYLLDILKIEYSKEVPVEDMIRGCSSPELFFAGIFICFLVPVFEEVIFRRIIFEGFRDRCPPVFSLCAASLLFAGLHGILFQLLPLFALGIYFQILYNREKKMGASVYAHIFNNTFAFCALLILRYTSI